MMDKTYRFLSFKGVFLFSFLVCFLAFSTNQIHADTNKEKLGEIAKKVVEKLTSEEMQSGNINETIAEKINKDSKLKEEWEESNDGNPADKDSVEKNWSPKPEEKPKEESPPPSSPSPSAGSITDTTEVTADGGVPSSKVTETGPGTLPSSTEETPTSEYKPIFDPVTDADRKEIDRQWPEMVERVYGEGSSPSPDMESVMQEANSGSLDTIEDLDPSLRSASPEPNMDEVMREANSGSLDTIEDLDPSLRSASPEPDMESVMREANSGSLDTIEDLDPSLRSASPEPNMDEVMREANSGSLDTIEDLDPSLKSPATDTSSTSEEAEKTWYESLKEKVRGAVDSIKEALSPVSPEPNMDEVMREANSGSLDTSEDLDPSLKPASPNMDSVMQEANSGSLDTLEDLDPSLKPASPNMDEVMKEANSGSLDTSEDLDPSLKPASPNMDSVMQEANSGSLNTSEDLDPSLKPAPLPKSLDTTVKKALENMKDPNYSGPKLDPEKIAKLEKQLKLNPGDLLNAEKIKGANVENYMKGIIKGEGGPEGAKLFNDPNYLQRANDAYDKGEFVKSKVLGREREIYMVDDKPSIFSVPNNTEGSSALGTVQAMDSWQKMTGKLFMDRVPTRREFMNPNYQTVVTRLEAAYNLARSGGSISQATRNHKGN